MNISSNSHCQTSMLLCSLWSDCSSLKSFLACILIALNKNPEVRCIGVGEVNVGKSHNDDQKDVMKAAGSWKVCARQGASVEAAIHKAYQNVEAVLLIDDENVFNAINRKAMIRNISVIYPIISNCANNCYNTPAHQSIIAGSQILPKEGTAQGHQTVVVAYALGVTSLIHHLLETTSSNKLQPKEIA